jgi:hypothetical protein
MMMLHLFGKINNNNSYVRTTTKKAAAVATTIFTLATIIAAVSSSMMVTTTSAAEATTGAGGGGEGTSPPTQLTYESTPPSLSVPNDMVLQTNGPTALLVYSVTAQDNRDGTATLDEYGELIQGDNVGGSIEIDCDPASQYSLPVGNRIVTCRAFDSSSNLNFAYFIVTVRDPTSPAPTDTIAPSLTKPLGLEITTNSLFSKPARYLFDVSATDNVDGTATLDRYGQLRQDNVGGSITMACNPPSFIKFPVGNTIVTCSAADAAGNVGTASFPVTVVSTTPEDTIPPVIQEPNILPSRSPAGATTYTVVVTDNVDGTATLGEYDTTATQDNVGGPILLECRPSSGSVFSVGDNIRCDASDNTGNGVEIVFPVPTVDVPQAATLNATAPLVDATTPSPLVNATTPLVVEEEEEAPPPPTITPEEEEEAPPPPTITPEEEDDTTTDEGGGAGDTGGGGDDTEDGGGDEPPATTTEGGGERADEGAASPPANEEGG